MGKVVIYLAFLGLFSQCKPEPYTQTGSYRFEFIRNSEGVDLLIIDPLDSLKINRGSFGYFLLAKDSLFASGQWNFTSNTLTFEYSQPMDTVRHYEVITWDAEDLVIMENDVIFGFKRKR